MAYVTLFVPEEALNIPTHGTIQYHPSLLPLHKGPSSINWPIIFGETRTGLTIFWPDNGLDTGPVLLQKEVDIGPRRHVGQRLLRSSVPGRRGCHDRSGGHGSHRHRAQDTAMGVGGAPDRGGSIATWHLRGLVPSGAGGDRLARTGGDGVQPDSRCQSATRVPGQPTKVSQLQVFDSRKVDGTGLGRSGNRHGAGRRRIRGRRRGWIDQGHAREAHGSGQGARGRVRRDRRASPRMSVWSLKGKP